MPAIHPTAVVDPGARLASDVSIGPFCCIGPDVELGPNVVLQSHVVVAGRTTIGRDTTVSSFACLGTPPQHLGYRGEPSTLTIGERNVIREYVTMNPGTQGGRMRTQVGNDGMFMVGAHIAHDCFVGSGVIMANYATLGGHVDIGDHVMIGGLAAVHQFVRVGDHAMIGGVSGVRADVIPFGLAVGERAELEGLNLVGLKRRGFSREDIKVLRAAYRSIFDTEEEGGFEERVAAAADRWQENPQVSRLLAFIREDSHRALCHPRKPNGA